jgi:hypothetical protein
MFPLIIDSSTEQRKENFQALNGMVSMMSLQCQSEGNSKQPNVEGGNYTPHATLINNKSNIINNFKSRPWTSPSPQAFQRSALRKAANEKAISTVSTHDSVQVSSGDGSNSKCVKPQKCARSVRIRLSCNDIFDIPKEGRGMSLKQAKKMAKAHGPSVRAKQIRAKAVTRRIMLTRRAQAQAGASRAEQAKRGKGSNAIKRLSQTV